jgi:hypothetical protein
MKNKFELSDSEEIKHFSREYYPERPLTEKETGELDRKVEKKITSGKKSIFKIISHLKALRRYMLDRDVKWYRKSIVVAALVCISLRPLTQCLTLLRCLVILMISGLLAGRSNSLVMKLLHIMNSIRSSDFSIQLFCLLLSAMK